MPKHLLAACFFYIVSLGAMAVLAPLYETGIARVSSPVLMLLFIVVAVLFMRRIAWTWKFMQWISFSEIAINAFFFPNPAFYGIYTNLARMLVAVIMVACCVILWSLFRDPASKAWFSLEPRPN